jgi:hypothetical protein
MELQPPFKSLNCWWRSINYNGIERRSNCLYNSYRFS